VARALDLFSLEIHFTLRQRELLVATAVIQDKDLLVDTYSHQDTTVYFELARHALLKVTELTKCQSSSRCHHRHAGENRGDITLHQVRQF